MSKGTEGRQTPALRAFRHYASPRSMRGPILTLVAIGATGGLTLKMHSAATLICP